VDPEARPSIAQLLSAFGAIATEKALPEYKIPQEAVERRIQREITAKKREERNNKTAKKIAPRVVPLKVTGPLDCNSVAARRIAMKKGIIPQSQHVNSKASDSSESLFEADFGSNLPQSQHVNSKASDSSKSLFEADFGNNEPLEKAWDAFDISSSSSKINHDNEHIQSEFLFDAFSGDNESFDPIKPPKPPKAQLPSQESESLFDWNDAADKPINDTANKNRIVHANSQQSFDNFLDENNNEFDEFDDTFNNSTSKQLSPSSAQSSSRSQPFSSFPKTALKDDNFLFDTHHPPPPPRASSVSPMNPNSQPTSPRPHPMTHTVSLPTVLPSYELDLLDTTPGK
jgi:hypothetical protein